MSGEVEIGRKLVGIPADEFIAGVGIDGTESIGVDADLDLVGHGMAGKGRMVGLKVHLEVLGKSVLAEEVQAGCGVAIVLVGGRLLWLGLNVELSRVADLFLVIDGHVKEASEVIEFTFHVGVPESGISLATTPEGVVLTTEFMGDFHCLLHLGGGMGIDIGIRAGGCAMKESRIAKEAGCAPEELDAGALLIFLQDGDNGIEIFVALSKGFSFGSHIPVRKA